MDTKVPFCARLVFAARTKPLKRGQEIGRKNQVQRDGALTVINILAGLGRHVSVLHFPHQGAEHVKYFKRLFLKCIKREPVKGGGGAQGEK